MPTVDFDRLVDMIEPGAFHPIYRRDPSRRRVKAVARIMDIAFHIRAASASIRRPLPDFRHEDAALTAEPAVEA